VAASCSGVHPNGIKGVLVFQSGAEVTENGRDEVVLKVVTVRAGSRAQKVVVASDSEVGVTGEVSSFVFVTFGEVFFYVDKFWFRSILEIVSTFVF